MKICFATEVTYTNYTNRIKNSSLKCFLDQNLDEFEIFYYISTNLPDDLENYNNVRNVKIFDIDKLRENNFESKSYELFPENPIGLYPSKYPWNSRRFIIEQAAKDGFDYIIYIDADTIFNPNIDRVEFYKQIINSYEPNTVKTNSTIFRYVNKSPEDVFNFHNSYIDHFNLDYNVDDYDTLDGPCQVFIGETNEDILRLVKIWDDMTIFGYKKEFGFGYGNNKHGNLSFVIPMSGFKLKWSGFPFYPNHIIEDRYTHSNQINNTIQLIQPTISNEENNVTIQNNEIVNNTNSENISFYFSKYFCDKNTSGYNNIYDVLFSSLKNEKLKILEIGVGTISVKPLDGMGHVPGTMYGWKEKNNGYQPGSSLRAFRDFFINSEIYGIDIQNDCLINEDNINTYIVDSTDKQKCDEIFSNNFFDIIIDDGNHDFDYRKNTFLSLFSKLSENGLYIIEGVLNYEMLSVYFDELKLNYRLYNNNLLIINNNIKIDLPKSVINEISEMKQPEITSVRPDKHLTFINKEDEFKINGIKFADRGFFINLPSSQDRLELVINQIKKYNIEGLNRFDALTDELRHFSCTKSHLKVFENSLINDFEIIFVAEDDFMIEDICYQPKIGNKSLLDSLSDVYEDLKSVEWDVLLFGCNPKSPLIPITNNLSIVNRSTGAWAYLIKKNAYRYLLKNSEYNKDYLAIDDWLPLLNDKGFVTLTTIPLTINHGVNLISTLQPSGPVNYDTWIKGSYHKHFYDIYPNNYSENNEIEKNITIVITGHFVDDFLFYLKYLFHSLPNDLKRCKIIINYDESGEGDIGHHKYELEAFFKNVITGLNTTIQYSSGGLISSIKNVIETIKTPYFLFLEHDWVFLNKDNINFNNLLSSFNNNDFINAVWFSKDDNIMRGFEITDDIDGKSTPFEVDNRVVETNLITTCRWSNNPALFRLSKFKNWYYNIIKNEHVDVVNQGCHNVEETMIPYYREQIRTLGWDNVKDEWGTYLYGDINEGPYVGHTDASKRYQGHNKSAPEINGEEYIKNNPI
jgi:GR25 family glycosyltransferase involved in LPS biosynthesis